MMTTTTTHRHAAGVALIAVTLLLPFTPTRAVRAPAMPAPCAASASRGLADIGNALTSGNDASVLQAALSTRSRFLACGRTADAVSADLVAADAYGDVNQPAARCASLREARAMSQRIGDSLRARLIGRALRGC